MTSKQSTIIRQCIESYLDKGMRDKQEIYSKVVEELGVPRPTVRRVARDLRQDYINKMNVLQSGLDVVNTFPEK